MPQPLPFEGFRPEAIDFLADLAANNERSWFQPRKGDYERLIRQPFEALVVALAERFAAGGIPLEADPRRSIFRIHRDTRFARDKSPYKTHQSARFTWLGGGPAGMAAHAHGAGGYFHFEPGEMYLGGGMFLPERPLLEAWRRRVVDQPAQVHEVLGDPGFVAAFGSVTTHDPYKRVPSGYPADHPDAELLRMRDVVFGRRLSDADVLSRTLPGTIADAFEAAVPVLRLLASLEPVEP
jgi:uncharacterized protein (TIGR02453 family)